MCNLDTGDVQNSGAPFWEALVSMVCADPSDMVALEAIRSMFGAPPPHPESLRRRQVGCQDLPHDEHCALHKFSNGFVCQPHICLMNL